jgi:[acyl-carrier-protein] S-malonyltransferase
MGRALYEREPAARAVFDQADRLLGFPLSTLCFEGPADELTDTVNQQPALFVTGVAAWRVIQEQGPDLWPSAAYFAGHSLGEFTALAAAGSLSFADGLALVRRRGELMKQAGETAPGAMAAILGLDSELVAAICQTAQVESGAVVQLANDNCPGQVVISGDSGALALAMELLQQAGARKVVPLPITIAAHSPLMATAAAEFAEAVAATPLGPPSAPVIGNTSARPLTTPDAIREELIAQLTGSVRWTESMRYLREQGVDHFVEVGPGDVLTGLMKRIDRQAGRQAFMPAPAETGS